MMTNSEVEELLKEMVIRRIRKKYFGQLFELVMRARKFEYARSRELTGESVQKFSRLAKSYPLFEMFLPVFGIFGKDFETILVAVSGDRLIGYSHLHPHGRGIWDIVSTGVGEMYRRRGIFVKLLKEDLRYISGKNGERAFTHIPPFLLKVFLEKLKWDVFSKEIQLLVKLGSIPIVKFNESILIRGVKSADLGRIYQICEALSPRKMQAYKIAPGDFRDSFLSRIKNKMTWASSKKWVVEVKGKIVGYVHIIYTPPEQTAAIQSFCVLPSSKSPKLISLLLSEALRFLAKRNIKKVTVFLDEEWKETIQIFERFGFKPIAPNYLMIHELV